ncbi:MAG: hypothetical protein WCF45_10745 [Photobacterium halotolerans]
MNQTILNLPINKRLATIISAELDRKQFSGDITTRIFVITGDNAPQIGEATERYSAGEYDIEEDDSGFVLSLRSAMIITLGEATILGTYQLKLGEAGNEYNGKAESELTVYIDSDTLEDSDIEAKFQAHEEAIKDHMSGRASILVTGAILEHGKLHGQAKFDRLLERLPEGMADLVLQSAADFDRVMP